MRFREWFREGPQGPNDQDPPASAELQRLREISRELLTAGADAIEKALSANSEEFLSATRQESGQ